MAQNGTATFAEPDDYSTAIGAANVSFVVTGAGDFSGCLTWLNVCHLHVLRGRENLPRIGLFSLPSNLAFVSFPTSPNSSLIYSGVDLQFGDVVFHNRGEKAYQRTVGDGQWGLISVPLEQLAACGKALMGLKIVPPLLGRILRPSRIVVRRLLRLHAKACRLAETRHELIAHPEVARAIEQEVLRALVHCLTADDANVNLERRRRHTDVMVRFEDAIAAHGHQRLNLPELCSAIGVPERTLRACCTEFLGLSPTRYHLMRRLNMVRSALLRADSETASITEIAGTYQFQQPGRFAVAYRSVFGEMPSSTLKRSPVKTS